MNELTIEGFVFYLFWGSVLMLVLGFSVWVWETVADARHRKRFWRAMEKRNRDWINQEWSDSDGLEAKPSLPTICVRKIFAFGQGPDRDT